MPWLAIGLIAAMGFGVISATPLVVAVTVAMLTWRLATPMWLRVGVVGVVAVLALQSPGAKEIVQPVTAGISTQAERLANALNSR